MADARDAARGELTIGGMRAEIVALRATLAYYAAPSNWRDDADPAYVRATQDRGRMARLALDLPLDPKGWKEKAVDVACRTIAREATSRGR